MTLKKDGKRIPKKTGKKAQKTADIASIGEVPNDQTGGIPNRTTAKSSAKDSRRQEDTTGAHWNCSIIFETLINSWKIKKKKW